MRDNNTPTMEHTRRQILKLAGAGGLTLAMGTVDAKGGNDSVHLVQLGVKHQISLNDPDSEEAVRFSIDMANNYDVQNDLLSVAKNSNELGLSQSNGFVAASRSYSNDDFESVGDWLLPYDDSKVLPTKLSSDLRPIEGIPMREIFSHEKAKITPKPMGVAKVSYNGQQMDVHPDSSATIESEKQEVAVRTQFKSSDSKSKYASGTTVPSLVIKNLGSVTIHQKTE